MRSTELSYRNCTKGTGVTIIWNGGKKIFLNSQNIFQFYLNVYIVIFFLLFICSVHQNCFVLYNLFLFYQNKFAEPTSIFTLYCGLTDHREQKEESGGAGIENGLEIDREPTSIFAKLTVRGSFLSQSFYSMEYALMKKKYSSYIRKFRWDRVQSHI